MIINPFAPHYGSNKILACTATPQSTTISNQNSTASFLNTGSFIAYVRIGNGDQSIAVGATPAVSNLDFPVPPNSMRTILKPMGSNGNQPLQVGYVSPDGATSLQVMSGNGGV